jgi:hypothetical protein
LAVIGLRNDGVVDREFNRPEVDICGTFREVITFQHVQQPGFEKDDIAHAVLQPGNLSMCGAPERIWSCHGGRVGRNGYMGEEATTAVLALRHCCAVELNFKQTP